MKESGHYPPGTEFDPAAPWNQDDGLDEGEAVCEFCWWSGEHSLLTRSEVSEDGSEILADCPKCCDVISIPMEEWTGPDRPQQVVFTPRTPEQKASDRARMLALAESFVPWRKR